MDSSFNPPKPVFDFQLPERSTEVDLEPDIRARVNSFEEELASFRALGALEPAEVKRLHDYFRLEHVYHSAGIEGNRLTLRETEAVLAEGILVGDKPLADQKEVQDLDAALRFLYELAQSQTPLREIDIRELHRLAVSYKPEAEPGRYRSIGVLITGSEHRPPEPLAVPALMDTLVQWINAEENFNPLVKASIAHHYLAAVHPFVDGNGRVARLLLNLILLRAGYPIVNIKREDRPRYYESLTFADLKLYSPLVELILERGLGVLGEMKRIREETSRAREWAARWGQKEATVLQRREEREYKLWLGLIENVRLEFENRCDLLDEQLDTIQVEHKDYPPPDFSKYLELKKKGRAAQNWFFVIKFRNKQSNLRQQFLFRFYRDYSRHPGEDVIPLELNWFIDGAPQPVDTEKIALREIWLGADRQYQARLRESQGEVIRPVPSIASIAERFLDDVLKHCFGIVPQ
jgi:Fic family protein